MRKLYKENNQSIPAVLWIEEGTQTSNFSLVTDVLESWVLSTGKCDYLCRRDLVIQNANPAVNWDSLSNNEKDLLIDLSAYSDSSKAVIHLMTTKGLGQNESIDLLRMKGSKHLNKDAESCRKRSHSNELTYVVFKYLSREDGTDFIEVTEPLNELYTDRSIKGLNDGSYKSGLFDFIESTHEYIGAGLEEQGYNLLTGTWQDFKNDLMSILRFGNYES